MNGVRQFYEAFESEKALNENQAFNKEYVLWLEKKLTESWFN